MTPERWQEIKQVLERLLPLTQAEREISLTQLGGGDPELRAEVESLLSAHEGRPDFLAEPYSGTGRLGPVDPPETSLDRVLGAYRLVELVGQGGMGAVYRAVRADGLYSRSVAVKLIRSALSSEFFLRRFVNERAILARLDHPNVARLLDGGATPEGVPYVVMEFVDGVPIDRYCERAGLSIRERLKLFCTVCAAVQYAHQNLIVHRDLKPGNILVSAQGEPKLVDFGIAKLLDLGQEPETETLKTALPLMTPQFASPEQLRGEPVTTASDLYSLGIVLYGLITGHRPYGGPDTPAPEMMRIACEVEPTRPSAVISKGPSPSYGEDAASRRARRGRMRRLKRALQGDLDSIVLKALRKDPRERYATVQQLREDIQRHLDGLPVMARRGTTAYLVRKFLTRHATAVAVASGVALLLIVSALISVREARLARLEAARAERRFNDVRELAGSLMFDVHDAIRDLPGSTPARKVLVDRALKYLDRLSTESANDRSLMRELATAYERVGEVEGHFLKSNLGDVARSLDSYQKALVLRQRLAGTIPYEAQDQLALANCYRRVANQLWATGNIRGARDEIAEAISVASKLPQNMDVLSEEAAEYDLQEEIFGNTEMGGLADPAAALQSVRHQEQIVAAMLKLSPDSAEVQHSYQRSLMKLGDMLQASGDLEGALRSFRQGLDVAQRLQERHPTAENARTVAVSHNHVAVILDLLGDTAGSLSSTRESLKIYRELVRSDPRNELMQRGASIAKLNFGTQLILGGGDSAAGMQALDESVATAQSMVAANPENLRDISMLAGMYEGRGDAHMHLRESQLAAADYKKACELYERAHSADPGDAGDAVLAAECHARLGRALLSEGRTEAAVQNYQQALALLKPSLVVADPDVDALYLAADSYAGLGDSERAQADAPHSGGSPFSGHWQSARTWYASSLDTWKKIPRAQYRRSPTLPVDGPDIVAEKLQLSESALAGARASPGSQAAH